jgi:hypothetical protein
MLGDFSVSRPAFQLTQAAARAGLEVRTEGSVRVNDAWAEMTADEQKWWQNHLYLREHELRTTVVANRADKFKLLGMDKAGLENELFQPILDGETALQLGLVDKLGTISSYLHAHHGHDKLRDITPKTPPLRRL